eukprot:6202889-Amphidinium_carterae.1
MHQQTATVQRAVAIINIRGNTFENVPVISLGNVADFCSNGVQYLSLQWQGVASCITHVARK